MRTVARRRARATAEAAKLVENIFRAVNIALVNELKIVFDRMGIDVWEVLDAASTKPFGFMRFNPGPGLGRPLHPARSVLPVLEGARVRRRRRSSSSSPARSTSQMPRLRGREAPARAQRPRQGRSRAAGSWSSGSPTRRTSTTRARARPSRSSSAPASSAPRSRYHDPARPEGAADALVARPAADDVACR